jgi:hypothetical protein
MSFYRLISMMINHILPVYEIHKKVMPKTRLLDSVRNAIRVRQYSLSTERAYIAWIRRFILFHGKRHPTEMEKLEIEAFLTHLAVNRAVSPDSLSDGGKVEWMTLMPVLVGMGVLTLADLRTLALLCESLANCTGLENAVQREGFTIAAATGGGKAHLVRQPQPMTLSAG